MKKDNLLVSVSGGETSMFMAWWLKQNKSDEYNMKFVFANTGEENEETLKFIQECSDQFDLDIVWLESVHKRNGKPITKKGWGCTYRVVNFDTASRNGEPFEEMISVLGIPNRNAPFCSPQLKKIPIQKYANDYFNGEEYYIAIGIRNDEIDRVNDNRIENRILYPLIQFKPMTKRHINFWWSQQEFRLNLKGYQGNCKSCWKKSFRKLMTIYVENPDHFNNFKKWEIKYGEGTTFFRGDNSVIDIAKMSQKPFTKASDDSKVYSVQDQLFDVPLDESNGCSESCEIF